MQGKALSKWMWIALVPLVAACSTTVLHAPSETTPPAFLPVVAPLAGASVFDHCGVGCPSGGSLLTLSRQAYKLNNNGTTKFANWVAYKITKSSSANGRIRKWQTDPDIPAGETLTPEDYKGASAALSIDRGHQANLASMAGARDWKSLNYMSNITPQKADLNQGPWAHLEVKVRELSKRKGINAVHVITGPLYERFVGTLPGTSKVHTIPSGYWKILFTGSTPEKGLYASFVMDQNTPRTANFCDFQVTVDQIESRSGLTVWSGLSDQAQNRLKSVQGRLPEMLGCS